MTQDFDTDRLRKFDKFFEKYFISNAPECDVFRENLMLAAEKSSRTLITHMSKHIKNGDDLKNIGTPDMSKVYINLYNNCSSTLFDRYSIAEHQEELVEHLESSVFYYLCITVVKNIGRNMRDPLRELKRIERASKNLLKALNSVDLEHALLFAGAFSVNDFGKLLTKSQDELKSVKDSDHFFERMMTVSRFESLKCELEYYSDIQEHFKNTFVGKWYQFGVSGPKENTALAEWIGSLADVWVNKLGRSLSYSPEKYSGREQFLRFAEDCMEPLHPDVIGTDSIRNAYEKLRVNGKFDYLSKKVD